MTWLKRGLLALVLTLSLALPAAAEELSFGELYSGYSSEGLTFSDKVQNLAGSTVTMTGYMAPPLTPTIRFFVLTEVAHVRLSLLLHGCGLAGQHCGGETVRSGNGPAL